MTLNARERFRQSIHAKTWQDLVDSSQFQEAATAAMTTMSRQAINRPQIEGAWLFLEILMSLTAPVPQPGKPVGDNLYHEH